MNTPQVYVGTYAKYNAGDLSGAWLTLTDYKDYAAFCAACRKVHQSERDPEFMIQDCSDMPDGLSVMEWLTEEEFNDIIEAVHAEQAEETGTQPAFQIIDYSDKAIAVVGDTRDIKDALKKLGGRFNPRLSCGCGWVFSKSKQADVEQLLSSGKVSHATSESGPKAPENPYKAILEEFIDTLKTSSNKTYYKDYNIGAIRANGGYILLPKPNIETRFCFHDEGPQYEEYKRVTGTDNALKCYFLAENLDQVDRRIKSLESDKRLYITKPSEYNGSVNWYEGRYGEKQNGSDVEISQELRAELVKAYKLSRALFEKRLHTYLRRYGTSKIHTWTYWADA